VNEAQRSERRVDRLVMRLFRHRHRWQEYRLIGNSGRTIFYCRKCPCGVDQVQNAGPMGDGSWQDRSQPLTHNFEREWLDGAKPFRLGGHGHPRWRMSEVEEWIERQRRAA